MYQLITGRLQGKDDIRGALFIQKITSSLSCVLLFQSHDFSAHQPYYDQQHGKAMANQIFIYIYITHFCIPGLFVYWCYMEMDRGLNIQFNRVFANLGYVFEDLGSNSVVIVFLGISVNVFVITTITLHHCWSSIWWISGKVM